MAKKKVCKRCKLFVETESCPQCGISSFSNSWQGRILITDAENSMIAQKIGIKLKGEYAIKVK
ncbi:MAG: DNA-directed RNA polymerase subunit E'' [Candidatus Buchananbacteria bacterium RIFCSPLOWO2_01_FULL_40_23b]|uniref:DNA-directed RNA polymerase subunit E n=1 Tax=Candidatus Buchananbacteria bacterium RIFCSPLOWO2_01_FULL_40_23b TaxID=1797544 RepID=A0A1G1YNK7_9BACT|nr:MAG: DNA-directed RNA polymerase subunit E'' [Candidatus Buchananbacteria bacterium RIFCSPLOWO2_01_FULL_40_23b]